MASIDSKDAEIAFAPLATQSYDGGKSVPQVQASLKVLHRRAQKKQHVIEGSGSKYGQVSKTWTSMAGECETEGRMKQGSLTGPKLTVLHKKLLDKQKAGDYSIIGGADSPYKAMLDEYASLCAAAAQRTARRKALIAKMAAQKAARGKLLRTSAMVAGRGGAYSHQSSGEGAGAGCGAGAGAGAGCGAGAGVGPGVAGSTISREAVAGMRRQREAWAAMGGDSDDDGGPLADEIAPHTAKRRRRNGPKGGKGGKGGPAGRKSVSIERAARVKMDNGIAHCISELPAIEQERIASQERIRLAEIESRRAEAEANRRAAAERHQREVEARAACRTEMMEMFKMAFGQKKDGGN